MYLVSWPLTWPGKCPHLRRVSSANQKPVLITGSQWEASIWLNELLKGEWLQRWSKVNTSLTAQTRNPCQGSSDISQKYTSIHPHAVTGTTLAFKILHGVFLVKSSQRVHNYLCLEPITGWHGVRSQAIIRPIRPVYHTSRPGLSLVNIGLIMSSHWADWSIRLPA